MPNSSACRTNRHEECERERWCRCSCHKKDTKTDFDYEEARRLLGPSYANKMLKNAKEAANKNLYMGGNI